MIKEKMIDALFTIFLAAGMGLIFFGMIQWVPVLMVIGAFLTLIGCCNPIGVK